MKVFFYGNAMDLSKPLHTHYVRGELRQVLNQDAAAIFGEFFNTVVWGQLQEWNATDIAKMNSIEAPEYQAERVKLNDGTTALAYAYTGQDFELSPPIENGKYYPTKASIAESMQDDEEMPDSTIR